MQNRNQSILIFDIRHMCMINDYHFWCLSNVMVNYMYMETYYDLNYASVTKWTDLQSTAIWLGMFMGILGLAGLCQKRANNACYCLLHRFLRQSQELLPSEDLIMDSLGHCQISIVESSFQFPQNQPDTSSAHASANTILCEKRDKVKQQEAGPLFQDLTSGWIQPESDNNDFLPLVKHSPGDKRHLQPLERTSFYRSPAWKN